MRPGLLGRSQESDREVFRFGARWPMLAIQGDCYTEWHRVIGGQVGEGGDEEVDADASNG